MARLSQALVTSLVLLGVVRCVPEIRAYREEPPGDAGDAGSKSSDPPGAGGEGGSSDLISVSVGGSSKGGSSAGIEANEGGAGAAASAGEGAAATGGASEGGTGAGGTGAGGESSGTGGASSGTGGSGGGAGAAPEAGGAPSAGEGGGGNETPSREGRWVGLTSQGRLIWFDVLGGVIAGIRFGWSLEVPVGGGVVCIRRGEMGTDLSGSLFPPEIDERGRFDLGPFSTNDNLAYTVDGTFTSDTQASGSLNLSSPAIDCAGSEQMTWDVEHVVCGDGRVSWPETCDPNDPHNHENCNVTCQLSPVSETEPNDTAPSSSVMAIEQDSVIAGALSQGDADLYAIRNPFAGTITIELETHTETVGTCHVNDGFGDTVLHVLEADGSPLATDDDGSRNFDCSYLALQIPAGRTVHVRVSSYSGAPIPAYNLHIKFQDS